MTNPLLETGPQLSTFCIYFCRRRLRDQYCATMFNVIILAGRINLPCLNPHRPGQLAFYCWSDSKHSPQRDCELLLSKISTHVSTKISIIGRHTSWPKLCMGSCPGPWHSGNKAATCTVPTKSDVNSGVWV